MVEQQPFKLLAMGSSPVLGIFILFLLAQMIEH